MVVGCWCCCCWLCWCWCWCWCCREGADGPIWDCFFLIGAICLFLKTICRLPRHLWAPRHRRRGRRRLQITNHQTITYQAPPPPALICGGAAALAVAVDIAVAVAGGVVNVVVVVVVVVGVGVGAVVVTSLLKLPKGPPRGRLGLYVAQRPTTRGCCPEARHAGGWDFMFWLWLWLWRWWLCWWWSCPEASHAGGCAQKPATRGYCPEARHAGGWDFRFWLCLGLWWWCDAGRQGR